jgi:hypothetical protein
MANFLEHFNKLENKLEYFKKQIKHINLKI